MSQLRQHEDDLKELGIQVLVVTFEHQSNAEAYVRDSDLRWPLLIDESRSLYQTYEVERASLAKVLSPASWITYAKLLLCGRRLKRSTGDIQQLGGDVLIDPDGIVRVHFVGNGPADRPSVDSLLEAVRQLAPRP